MEKIYKILSTKAKEAFRKGTVTTLCIILMGLFMATSCKKQETPQTAPENLKNTSWKLAGIVDVQAGTLTELEPKDCKECYTLTFDTDTTVSIHKINGVFYHLDLLNLTPDRYVLTYMAYNYIWNGKEYSDPDKFNVIFTEDYTVTSNELKLFYNKKKEYLLFKLIK